MERHTTSCRGHCGLSTLGNKLKASSLCTPWSPKLAFHTSLVPADVNFEGKPVVGC